MCKFERHTFLPASSSGPMQANQCNVPPKIAIVFHGTKMFNVTWCMEIFTYILKAGFTS